MHNVLVGVKHVLIGIDVNMNSNPINAIIVFVHDDAIVDLSSNRSRSRVSNEESETRDDLATLATISPYSMSPNEFQVIVNLMASRRAHHKVQLLYSTIRAIK